MPAPLFLVEHDRFDQLLRAAGTHHPTAHAGIDHDLDGVGNADEQHDRNENGEVHKMLQGRWPRRWAGRTKRYRDRRGGCSAALATVETVRVSVPPWMTRAKATANWSTPSWPTGRARSRAWCASIRACAGTSSSAWCATPRTRA